MKCGTDWPWRGVAKAGRAFPFDGCRFQIARRHRHRITAIRVMPPEQRTPPASTEAAIGDA